MSLMSVGRWRSTARPASAEQETRTRLGTDVTLYTRPDCKWCSKAKALLRERGIPFTEVDVGQDLTARAKLAERVEGRLTVPQIFIGETRLGGYTELEAADRSGELVGLLQGRSLANSPH